MNIEYVAVSMLVLSTLCAQGEEKAKSGAVREGVVRLHLLADKGAVRADVLANARAKLLENQLEVSSEYGWFPVKTPQELEHNDRVVSQKFGEKTFILARIAAEVSLDDRTKFRITNFEKQDPKGKFSGVIYVDLDQAGADQLHRITRNNIDASLGVFVLGELVTHATIREGIPSGRLAVSGGANSLEMIYKVLLQNTETK